MKKYIVVFSAILMIMAVSCNKQLDVAPQGAPASANFWKTQADAIAGINSIYQLYSNNDMYGEGFFWYANASDDIGTKAEGHSEQFKNFQLDGSESETKNVWGLHYRAMKRCNDAIRNIPQIDIVDNVLKNRLLGEAYFNHAIMHLELAYRFGNDKAGIPIQDRNDATKIYIPRTQNVAENYAYIESDLKMAASLLPYFDTYQAADYGRAHKTAAWAYLARTYLYAKDYQHCADYADSVINSGKHQLLDKFTDVFHIANNWSSEYIWSVTNSATFTNSVGCIFPGVLLEDKGWGLYNGWGEFYPTKELYDAYLPGDVRREATILKTGDQFMFFGSMRTFNVGQFTVSASNRTGYQFNKYMEPYSYANPTGTYINSNGDRPTTALNVPLLRYADVLLMKAEALLMLGKNADKELNMLRKRTGLPPYQNATLDDLKRERRCELAGEWTDRHWDLVRWGDAATVYAQPLHHADGHVIYPGRTFNPATQSVWPIPPDEIRLSNGTLTQNAGW